MHYLPYFPLQPPPCYCDRGLSRCCVASSGMVVGGREAAHPSLPPPGTNERTNERASEQNGRIPPSIPPCHRTTPYQPRFPRGPGYCLVPPLFASPARLVRNSHKSLASPGFRGYTTYPEEPAGSFLGGQTMCLGASSRLTSSRLTSAARPSARLCREFVLFGCACSSGPLRYITMGNTNCREGLLVGLNSVWTWCGGGRCFARW
jgi:hypothetical protein